MRHAFRFEWAGGVALASVLLLAAVAAGADSAPRYRLAHQVSLPGDEGWDYLTLEPEGHRLFIAHGTHVLVVDTGKLAVAGRIADTPGVHGIALAPELNRGYVSAGRAGLVVVFDLKTLALLKEIKTTGENPDAIVYDAATRHVFTFNGRGRNVTAIDAGTDQVVGTLALDAKPEFAVPDGRGRVYVNLEDRNSLAVLDARKLSVLSVWPIAGCEEPSGLAFDADRRHLFPVCSNRVMAVVDAASGRALGSAPIGAGVDAAAYDPGSGLAFASCGEGNLTVVRTGASGAAQVVQSVPTRRGARTNALAHEILKQLVEINTTDSVGNVTTAAEATAQRFREAGFPAADIAVLGSNERKKNLVVRLRGTAKHRPVLLIGHLDVVEARREDWSTDPFKLIEKDGYFYGRGTQDMKDGDAIMATTLLRMKHEGFRPSRDIILALTADEEGGCCHGVDWLIRNHRELIDAQFVLNHDGHSVRSEHGVPKAFELGDTEKVYGDYQLTVTNRGGHSSQPRPDNAIYELAAGLLALEKFRFPFELNNVTRGYFERMAAEATGQEAADYRGILTDPPDGQALERLMQIPTVAGILHTTCVATRLEGGHANNALPQRATANVNCRILPGHSQEEVRQRLIEVLDDAQITVRYVADNGEISDRAPDRRGYPPPPLDAEVKKPLEDSVAATWPGLKVIPYMHAGASA